MVPMLTSTLLFALMDCCVKELDRFGCADLTFYRCLISCAVVIPLLRARKIPLLGNRRWLLTSRGLTGAASLLLFFATLHVLPMPIAVTLQYLSPIFTTLIAALALREAPTRIQWITVFVAFVGVCLIQGLEPGGNLLYVALGGLGALLSAVAYVTIRAIGDADSPMVIVLYLGMAGVAVTLPWFVAGSHLPSPREAVLIALMGLSALGAQHCMTLAFQKQKAPAVANLTYLNLVWAMLANRWLWNEPLSPNALAGIALITGCALSAGSAMRWTGAEPRPSSKGAAQARRPTPDRASHLIKEQQ